MLLVAIACIQGGASLAASLFPAIGPAATTSLRLIIAAFIVLAIFRPWRWRVARADWRNIAV